MTTITIGKKKVGEKHPVFIIAEVGSNHNKDLKQAKKLIAFWTAEIPRLQEAIKLFTDVRERCPRIKRKQ